eukprot:1323341-Amphidinium_carterae.1
MMVVQLFRTVEVTGLLRHMGMVAACPLLVRALCIRSPHFAPCKTKRHGHQMRSVATHMMTSTTDSIL